MTHDPYQAHQMIGGYSGLTNPFTTPYGAIAGNPLAACSSLGAGWGGVQQQSPFISGQNPYGQNPFGQNPFIGALQNPFAVGAMQQNPLITAALQQNPFVAAALQQQQQNPYQQQQNPYIAAAVQQNPFVAAALQQAALQQAALLQNPFIAATLQQQNPFVAAAYSPYAQLYQQPHPQIGLQTSPFGQLGGTLAPQSWVGQGYGQQINPLLQAVTRGPWGGI